MTTAMLNGCAPIVFSSAATLASKSGTATLGYRATCLWMFRRTSALNARDQTPEQAFGELVAENGDLIDIVVRKRRQKRPTLIIVTGPCGRGEHDRKHRGDGREPTSEMPFQKALIPSYAFRALKGYRPARTIQRRARPSNAPNTAAIALACELACASTPSDGQQSILSPLAF